MAINWQETKKKFEKTYNQKGIACGIGVNPVIFCQVLNGKYLFMESARAKAVVAKLIDLDVLVTDPETQSCNTDGRAAA